MPLQVELDDGKRWRVCAARSRLQIKLRWTELEHPLLDPVRDVVYRHRTTRLLGLPVSQGNGVLTRAEGESAWTGTIAVEAGWFFSREIRFVVEDARDPPRAAGVQLVTRGSAVLSLALLVTALVVLAWRGAATLSTLHLNFSYSHALTGLGGLTLLGLAVKAVHTVTDELRVHGLPFWGMGYLLGRTLGACLLGACTLGVLLPNCVTTVVNETEANIELKLPDSPGRLVLGPDQQITFLGRVDQVGYTVQSSFAEEGRFCVVDERGMGVGICDPTPRQLELPGASDWRQQLFAPAALRVACKTRKYEVLQAKGDVPLPSDVVALLLPSLLSQLSGPTSNDLDIELDARCQPKGPGRARVDRPVGLGFEAVYVLTEPWTLAAIERFSRLVVQSSTTLELHLRLAAAPAPASPGADPAAAPVPGPVLTITVPPGRAVSNPIPTPHAPEIDEFEVIVSGSSLKAELSAVSCAREHTEAESHFRLIGLPLEDPYSRLLELSGRSTGAPGWSSRWRELRPEFPIDVSPMLCTASSGPGDDEVAPSAISPRALKLTLDVAFPRFGDPVVLRVPMEYAARRIEVVAHNDSGPVARGTLDCVLPELAAGSAYELSPVWITDSRNRPVRRVRELELGQAGQADAIEAAEGGAQSPVPAPLLALGDRARRALRRSRRLVPRLDLPARALGAGDLRRRQRTGGQDPAGDGGRRGDLALAHRRRVPVARQRPAARRPAQDLLLRSHHQEPARHVPRALRQARCAHPRRLQPRLRPLVPGDLRVRGSGAAVLRAPRGGGMPARPPDSPGRSLRLVVLVALAWLAPWSWAAAASGEVTVSLELDGEPEQPAWVCVASRAKGRAQVEVKALAGRLDARGQALAAADAESPARSPRGAAALDEALAAMLPVPAEPRCGQQADGGEACAPRVSLVPDDHGFVACVANERQHGSRSRVLWLGLSTRDSLGAPAAVERLSLNGAVLTLTTNLHGDEAVTVVQAIGGHYRADGDVRVRGARAATLSLEPLCRWVPVRVPPIQLPSGDEADPRPSFVLEDDGHATPVPSACVRGSLADETLEVRVPYNDSPAQATAHRGMRLRATIEQTVPRELLWRPPGEATSDAAGAPPPRREVVVIQQGSSAATARDDELEPVPPPAPEEAAVAPEPFAIDLSARWSGAWPSELRVGASTSATPTAPEALTLAPEVVTFFWPRDACFHPEGCPEARLASSARTCQPYPRSDGCYYRCEVGRMEVGVVGEAFRVPITFTDLRHGSPRPEWGATLDHLNQRFLRSVPVEQRRVRVELGAWSRSFVPAQDGAWADRTRGLSYGELLHGTRRRAQRSAPVLYDDPGPLVTARGDEIRALSFRGAFGNVHRIELGRGEHREYHFELPQARCGETVHVEIEGERQYRAVDVPLRAGTLVLEHPLALARVLYFGTGLSLGFTRVLSPRDARQGATWAPAAAIDLSLRFRPRRGFRAWRFDLPRVSYMLATQPYAPLGPDPGRAPRAHARALYSRFLVAALARTPDVRRIDIVKASLAFGLGLDIAAPVRSSDVDAVGELQAGLVPMAELLVRVSPRVELRLIEPRLYCLEAFHRHVTDLRGVAREDLARGRMCTLFLGAGVAGTW